MKDENGIKICCKNCNDDVAINCPHYNPDNPDEDLGCSFSREFVPSYDALFARIADLQEHNEILQKRIFEISMELLDYNMKENKDVLERLKEWEENFDKNTLTQSTESGKK